MTTPNPIRSLPYATLLAFTRYVDRTGPAKASFVGGLRKQRETGGGFNPHGQFVKALKADIRFRTGGTHLREVVKTVNPRWQRLYSSLAEGAERYLKSLGDPQAVWLMPTRDAIGMLGGLPVKISAHFGLRFDDGRSEVRSEAVRLHFDEERPSLEAITATLHLMRAYSDQIMPNAEPTLLDVRRGEVHRASDHGSSAEVERWLAGEAAGFSAMWTTAA
jgi:hypothetical protein